MHTSTEIQKEKDQIQPNTSKYDFARCLYTKRFFNRLNLRDGYLLTLVNLLGKLYTHDMMRLPTGDIK